MSNIISTRGNSISIRNITGTRNNITIRNISGTDLRGETWPRGDQSWAFWAVLSSFSNRANVYYLRTILNNNTS